MTPSEAAPPCKPSRAALHAISPATGKPFVPARWKVEER